MATLYNDHLVIGTWVFSSLCMLVIIIRLALRFLWIRKYQADDFLAIIALASVISQTATWTITNKLGNNLMTSEERASLNDIAIDQHILGSKLFLGGSFSYVTSIYLFKAGLLIFYERMTRSLPQNRWIPYMGAVLGASYLASMLILVLPCMPVNKLWQVKPDPGFSCSGQSLQVQVQSALNILTDLLLLSIPIPIIYGASLNPKQRLATYAIFSLSILSLASTMTRLILTFVNPTAPSHIFWACLETLSVAVVCNAPMLRSLLNKSTDRRGRAKGMYQRKSQQLSALTLNLVGAVRGRRGRRYGNTTKIECQTAPYETKAGEVVLRSWTDDEALVGGDDYSSKAIEADMEPQSPTLEQRQSSSSDQHHHHKPGLSLTSVNEVFVTREVHVDSETLRSYGDGSTIRTSLYGRQPTGKKSTYRVKDYEKWMGTVREACEEPNRPLRSLSKKKTHRLKITVA